MDLTGKAVLITGATGGLGRVAARRFLEEGARVAITLRDESTLKVFPKKLRSKLIPLKADVTSEESVSALFRRLQVVLKKVDILINAVGGFIPSSSFQSTSSKDWDALMTLNLKSVFLCSRAFLRQKHLSHYGRIINVAALAALRPSPKRAPYAVSKAGVVTLTQVLGEELKGTGVTVNALAPSIIRTEDNRRSMPEADSDRWVTPEDLSSIMVFLCSESAKSVNGAVIPIPAGV